MKFTTKFCSFSIGLVVLVLTILFSVSIANGQDKIRVLFVGNSLTYSNNLPEIINHFAKSAKQKKFSYKMIAYPNFSLEDHWNNGEVQKVLAKEKWDFVIMQQGSSASIDGRKLLVEYAKKFAEKITQAEAKSAMFMVWSSAYRLNDFAEVGVSYKLAAEETKGFFFPVGFAWLEAWKRSPNLQLYSADKFHPSPVGSYLAALIIYQQIYQQSPVGLPYKFRIDFETQISLTKEEAKILQETASETNKKYL